MTKGGGISNSTEYTKSQFLFAAQPAFSCGRGRSRHWSSQYQGKWFCQQFFSKYFPFKTFSPTSNDFSLGNCCLKTWEIDLFIVS